MMLSTLDRCYLTVFVLSYYCHYVTAAAHLTTISCNTEKACVGRQFEIRCKISANTTGRISWVRPGDNIEVVTCFEKGKPCSVAAEDKYKLQQDTTEQVLTIKSVSDADVGAWMCRDGTSEMGGQCNVPKIEAPAVTVIKARCEFTSSGNLLVACDGIISPGSPPVNATLEVNGEKELQLSSPSYSQNVSSIYQYVGHTVKCFMTGQASHCIDYEPASKVCPKVGLGLKCEETVNCKGPGMVCSKGTCQCGTLRKAKGEECGIDWGAVIGILVTIIAVIAIIAVGFLCHKKHTDKGYQLWQKFTADTKTMMLELLEILKNTVTPSPKPDMEPGKTFHEHHETVDRMMQDAKKKIIQQPETPKVKELKEHCEETMTVWKSLCHEVVEKHVSPDDPKQPLMEGATPLSEIKETDNSKQTSDDPKQPMLKEAQASRKISDNEYHAELLSQHNAQNRQIVKALLDILISIKDRVDDDAKTQLLKELEKSCDKMRKTLKSMNDTGKKISEITRDELLQGDLKEINERWKLLCPEIEEKEKTGGSVKPVPV